MTGMERLVGRLAAWMTALVIVSIGLNAWATNLLYRDASRARSEVATANGRLGDALDLLHDADRDTEELLEGQRTLAAQLEQAGIAPAIDVPARQPRRSAAVRPVSPRPDTTTTTRPADTSTSTTTKQQPTTTTTHPTTTTTRCLVLMLGCDLPLGQGGSGR